MKDIDILDIDNSIRKMFKDERDKLDTYKLKLVELQRIETVNIKECIIKNLKKYIKEFDEYINNVENQVEYYFYLESTMHIIEQYKQILNIPIKVNFIGKSKKTNKHKDELIMGYIKYAEKYIMLNIDHHYKKEKVSCPNCNNRKDFDIINHNIYICNVCYTRQYIMSHVSSYNDIDRINISTKYLYDRRIHFRDCIKQYQGKQNCFIHENVYNVLEEQFELHHLLHGDKTTKKEVRFKDITKVHILLFLKELKLSKHYENVHLIHYQFTGIKRNDISHIEEQLLDDFDVLSNLYDIRCKDVMRKSFINTQYTERVYSFKDVFILNNSKVWKIFTKIRSNYLSVQVLSFYVKKMLQIGFHITTLII